MTSNIEDLFGQIVSSEQRARQRKSAINDVKTKINECNTEIKKVEDNTKIFKRQMVIKARQYNDLKLQVRWAENTEKIHAKKSAELKKECSRLQQDKHTWERSVESVQQKFIGDVRSFCSSYDYISNGYEARQVEWENDIVKLQKLEEQLEQELSSYRQRQSDLEILSTQKAEKMVAMETCTAKLQDLTHTLAQERQQLIKLEADKQDVCKAPYVDPEFKKLQSELSSYKASDLESVCVSLEHELHALQRHQWQKQIQQKAGQHQSRPINQTLPARPPVSTSTPTPSSVILTNYSCPRIQQKPVAMTTPTHQGAAPTHQGATPTHQVAAAMQQPWEEMAEPMRADTPSGDQTVGDPMKRPVNIGKLSSAIKQRDTAVVGRFTFRPQNSVMKESTNEIHEDIPANEGSASSPNQIHGHMEPMAKKQRKWQQQQFRQQQFQQQGLRRQAELNKK